MSLSRRNSLMFRVYTFLFVLTHIMRAFSSVENRLRKLDAVFFSLSKLIGRLGEVVD